MDTQVQQPEGFELSPELQEQVFGNEAVSHPIDFDDVWVWLEYSRKDNALVALLAELDAGVDFITPHNAVFLNNQGKATGGRPSDKYYLSVDGFECFCMAAGTKRGKEVRRYFVYVKKAYKRLFAQTSMESVFLNAPKTAAEPVLCGTTYPSYLHLLAPADQWRDEMRRMRQRIKSTYGDNALIFARKLAEHDARESLGFDGNGTIVAPPAAPAKTTTTLHWRYRDDETRQRLSREATTFDDATVMSLFEGRKWFTHSYAVHMLRQLEPDLSPWNTKVLLMQMGYHFEHSTFSALDLHAINTKRRVQLTYWVPVQYRASLPSGFNAIDMAVMEAAQHCTLNFEDRSYIDWDATSELFNQQTDQISLYPKRVALVLNKAGWYTATIYKASKVTGKRLFRYTGGV